MISDASPFVDSPAAAGGLPNGRPSEPGLSCSCRSDSGSRAPVTSIPLAAAVADAAGVLLYRCEACVYPVGEAAMEWLNAAGAEG